MPVPPEPGLGVAVSPHMLNTAALNLNYKAEALMNLRDAFNSSCYAAKDALGSGPASQALNDFFQSWFSALDAQAETMGSVADATQQCAVIYDHVDRQVLGFILAVPTAPPPSPPKRAPDNPLFPHQRPPIA
jgi:uncharacterized protein YukE